ncbi:MAG: DUF1565 domain-containing protein [Bacteroidota bacterium]
MTGLWSCSSEEGINTDNPGIGDDIQEFSLQSPENGALDLDQGIVLQWASAGQGATYRLMVALSPDFSEPIIEQSGITETHFTIESQLDWNATFYWTVYASKNDKDDLQAMNGFFSFNTVANGTAQPSPLISKYFVAANGEDAIGNGSMQNPFKTIAYAAKQVPELENDTIFVFNGKYEETQPILLPLGTNLIGESTEGVIIQSRGVELPSEFNLKPNEQIEDKYEYALIQMISDQNLDGNHELAHFTLDGMQKQLEAGIWAANRNNIAMHHITIKDVNFRGAAIGTTEKPWFRLPETYITGVSIFDCYFENSGQDFAEYSTGNLNLGQLEGAEVYNIRITDNIGYGIKFLWDGYFKSCHFHDIETNLSEDDKLWDEDIAIELWNLGPGNIVEDIKANTWLSLVNHPFVFPNLGDELNLILRNAHIIDGDGSGPKEGLEIGTPHTEVHDCYIENKAIGLALWNMGHNNVTIHHNIFRNENPINNWAGGTGIYIDNSRNWDFEDIHIYHNVIDSYVYALRVRGQRILDIAIKNNLFINSSTADLSIESGSINFSNNFKHSNNLSDWSILGNVSTLENNLYGDALIKSSGDRWDTFYQPLAQSPLINAGQEVGFAFNASSPDIGPFEY